jgi:very-short-patch-repair endonuclease
MVVVATPKGSTPGRPVGVRVRETRRYRAEDVVGVGIPRMRPAVAAIHAALWARSDRQAKLFVVMTVQQRLATVVEVADVVGRIRRHTRRRMLRALMVELAAGAQSLGELDVGGALRRRGLPEPVRQSVRKRPDGTHYLDVEWPDFHLVLEIDGAGHEQAVQAVKDVLRDMKVIVDGQVVIRIKLVAWAVDQEAILDGLEEVFRARGWARAA